MRAIVIDPYEEAVYETKISEENYFDDIKKIIKCDCLTFVYSYPKHFLLLDDVGLYQCDRYFIFKSYPQPLAGIGVLIGNLPPEGDATSATASVEDVKKQVVFPGSKLHYHGMKTFESKEYSEVFDQKIATITTVPLFTLELEGGEAAKEEEK